MTILLDFLQAASSDERERCALLAGTTVNYLYQLAGCNRQQAGSDLALRIEDATTTMNIETSGRLPAISVRELAAMCAVAKLAR